MAWATDRKHPGRSVVIVVIAGCLLTLVLAGAFFWACHYAVGDAGPYACRVIERSPPWVLLAGLATLPGVALGWYWRTDIHNEELDNAEEKGRAERFVKYAEMLSHDKDSSMLGAIHGLKHLGIEDERRKGLVVDMLCSFIRSHASRDYGAEKYADMHEQMQGPDDDPPSPPSLTVTTAIEALSGLKANGADLRGVDLDHLDANEVTITKPDFREARLVDAKLRCANLSHGRFDEAMFSGADLTDADLRGARFTDARLWGTIFYGANLTGADLSRAQLSNADLRGAILRGANLHCAKLDGATITGALMTREQLLSTKGEAQDAAIWRPIDAEDV